jgi:ADP-heptose:LPS heptosyltransferase
LKILILKPSSLGDVIQALPVLRLLKRHLPAAEIFWWIDSNLAPLLEGDPDLAGVVRFERRRWAAPRHWPEMLRSIRWMREQNFDWVIDLQCLARSGAFAWLANGKFLIGLDEVREGARGFYDVAVRRASFHTHAVDWYLAVLPRLGVPVHKNFQWLPERPAVAAEVKSQNGQRTARGGLPFSPARAGRTNAGRPKILPNSSASSRKISRIGASPFSAAWKTGRWAKLFRAPRPNAA